MTRGQSTRKMVDYFPMFSCGSSIGSFWKHAIFLFLALRVGDFVNLAAGLWFVPKYISPQELGAVLPVTTFATFLSLPVFAFAMTVMRESAHLSALGERGKLKTLLRGVFIVIAVLAALSLVGAALAIPRFLTAMRVPDALVGFLVVAAAFLGCIAPVYSDALQSLRKFNALGLIEIIGSLARFAVLAITMPLRALAGYFAGQTLPPLVRMAGSVFALRRDLSVPAAPYWSRPIVRKIALIFIGILAYQIAPMLAGLLEQSVIRTHLSDFDSAGFYMISRFSDFLYYLTFPLLLVMFPYTANASETGKSTRPFVLSCSLLTLGAAVLMMVVYHFFGRELLALLPHGADYAALATFMPFLVLITALTACQTFYTNAEVSAGRFGFLGWFIPVNAAYSLALSTLAETITSLRTMLVWMAALAALRFVLALGFMCRAHRTGTRRSANCR